MGLCCSKPLNSRYTTQGDTAQINSQSEPANNKTHSSKPTGRGKTSEEKTRVGAGEAVRNKSESMASRMAPAIINPSAKHTATVIFLHGLGDTGHGWCEEFKNIAHPWVKYIFPHAPAQPVTLNGGMRMPSWFDIKGLSPDAEQDEAGIISSSKSLKSLIEQESQSVPSNRIVIGGFSQGGAIALYTMLTSDTKYGGLLAFSTWLPLHNKLMPLAKDANKKTPVLQCHGDSDPMVPFALGSMTAMFLKQLNPDHSLIRLAGVMHSSSPQEMDESKKFLAKVIPNV